jgi:hypothetical protein
MHRPSSHYNSGVGLIFSLHCVYRVKRLHDDLLPIAARTAAGGAAVGDAASAAGDAASAAGDAASAAGAAAGRQQQPLPQDAGGGVTAVAAAVLGELQGLLPRLSSLGGGGPDLGDGLLSFAKDVAAAHSQLRYLAVVANTPAGEAAWKQELAEFTLCDYEDDMEAHHLLIYKCNAKFSGVHACMVIFASFARA